MDIERLLYEIMPVVVSRMYGNYKYEGLIDYEVFLSSFFHQIEVST